MAWGRYSRGRAASRAWFLSTCTDQRTTLPSSRVKTWPKDSEIRCGLRQVEHEVRGEYLRGELAGVTGRLQPHLVGRPSPPRARDDRGSSRGHAIRPAARGRHCRIRSIAWSGLESERDQGDIPSREALAESSFQATRYGLDAQLLSRAGDLSGARDLGRACLEEAMAFAPELNCERELRYVATMLDAGVRRRAPATRTRRWPGLRVDSCPICSPRLRACSSPPSREP